jgi:hypothetical protein
VLVSALIGGSWETQVTAVITPRSGRSRSIINEKKRSLRSGDACGSPWSDTVIERLADGDPEAQGRVLTACWCETHGAGYCAAIVDGQRKREDAKSLGAALQARQMRDALRAKA